MDVHSSDSQTGSVNSYKSRQKIQGKKGLKSRIQNLFNCNKSGKQTEIAVTFSSSYTDSDQNSLGPVNKVMDVRGKVFDKFDKKDSFYRLGDKKTIKAGDFAKIVDYVENHKEELFRMPDRYYRHEQTGLSHTIQIHIPEDAKSSDEMNVIIHLKSPDQKNSKRNVHEICGGFEKWIKLSVGFNVGKPSVYSYYATGTPKAASKYLHPSPERTELKKANSYFQKEIDFIKKFRGQRGVVQIITHSVYPIGERSVEQAPKINMVMKYADKDLFSLFEELFNKNSKDSSFFNQWSNNPVRMKYLVDLLIGLNAIHAQNIIHSDIKAGNILLCGGEAQIADFGFAADENEDLDKNAGTALYYSPEHLNRCKFILGMDNNPKGSILYELNKEQYGRYEKLISQKTDVYSLGICLYFMKYLTFPDYLMKKGYQKSRKDITDRDKIRDHIYELYDWYSSFKPKDKEGKMIKAMMRPDPKKRLSSKKACERARKIFPDIN